MSLTPSVRAPSYRVLAVTMFVVLFTGIILTVTHRSNDTLFAVGVTCIIAAVIFGIVHLTLSVRSERIDVQLADSLGTSLRRMQTFTKMFPGYRFVDIHNAAARFAESFATHRMLDCRCEADLNQIVTGQFYSPAQAKMKTPSLVPRDVDYKEEKYFPNDRFWTLSGRDEDGEEHLAVIRVKLHDYTQEPMLEIAAGTSDGAEAITEKVTRLSIKHSIYREKLLQISFEGGVKDEFGDVEASGTVQLLFRAEPSVTKTEIVLDEEIGDILDRNIFDFHRRREELRRFGVPSKKGVLFYGPPGTGKTFTCQYIYSTLKPVTTLIVTGQSLTQVRSICNLARMLQPSLLVLEDVDLIFTSREINLYSTSLGDLLDEMDGFASDDAVTFLMTTNAIDRLEAAIKDRPGRINQCIYFGHPGDELRERYIERYLRPYDAKEVDLPHVVQKTSGSSQAFIKELIYRAVQISLERTPAAAENGQAHLNTQDFDTALEEMTKFNEKAAGAIMGFRVNG